MAMCSIGVMMESILRLLSKYHELTVQELVKYTSSSPSNVYGALRRLMKLNKVVRHRPPKTTCRGSNSYYYRLRD